MQLHLYYFQSTPLFVPCINDIEENSWYPSSPIELESSPDELESSLIELESSTINKEHNN